MMNYASSIKHCELDNVKSRKNNIQTAPAQQRELQGAPRATSHRISHPMPATSGSAVRSLLNHPTSLARRALLLSVFLLSFGSAWGEEVAELWKGSITDGDYWTESTDNKAAGGQWLRVYVNGDYKIYIVYGDWNNIWDNKNEFQGSPYYNNVDKCYEFEITSDIATKLNSTGFNIQSKGAEIQRITLETKAAVVDPFFTDVPSTVATETDYSEELARTVTNGTFTLSGVNNLSGVTYARIFITDASDGELSDQSPLNVTYNSSAAPAAGNNATAVTKNGVYIYDGGNALTLANVSVTLTPASGKKLTDYKVVCLLSTGSMTGTTGSLTEPTCELKYTYLFQYEPLQAEQHDLGHLNLVTTTTSPENITFDIQSEMLKEFGNKTSAQVYQSWFTKWYVENNAGVRQSLSSAWGQTIGTWTFNGNSGTATADNAVFRSSNDNGGAEWNFANLAGKVTFYAPLGTSSITDYAGWKFVCETSDVYDGVNAEPTHIFYIPIPSPITFEYDGTPTNTDVVQTLESRTSTTSVTLDWTNTKVTPTITTAGYKYARFYVVDGTGTAVTPTDDTHKLTVTGGTLCTIGESGYYVYDGGSDITLPTVTLSSTGDVRDYKVVCWLANTLDNINPNNGTTPIVEEPDIDMAYTFSFKKPSVTSTVEKTKTITWSATSMAMDATAGAPGDWDTSWDDLSKAQYVKWYVVGADGTTKQPLALGTSRQADKWTIGLNSPFSVSDNVAVLTGQTSFTATNWNTWGKPAVYAPSNKAYADVYNYKVICEVSEEASATATPNVHYTFSFTKDFLGSNKSGITTSTQREVLANATDMTCTLSEVTLPAGTKYARFYLLDGSDNIVAPTDKLTVTGSKAVTVSGYENYGLYVYNESGITSAPTVTLTLETAELNLYRVVMVTSTDKAVLNGSADVISEPDYDTRKTWTFKYPTAHAEGTGEVEWSPVSMAVTPDIDALKGTGYLSSLGTNYHVVWTVENASGVAQALTTGSNRQASTWTVSRIGNNATFYAPTGQTFADVKDLKFVARLYETATGEDDNDLALTYTVNIKKTEFEGSLKDGAAEEEETVMDIDESATEVTVPLSNVISAFSGTAKYARVWLTQNGTVIDPTGKLSVGTAFTKDVKYGFYLINEDGVSLSNATLTVEEGTFAQYQVHVALSTDLPTGSSAFAPRRRAASLDSYEPDYDFLYTFDFKYAAKGKVIHKCVKWDQTSAVLEFSEDYLSNLGVSSLSELEDHHLIKWYIIPSEGGSAVAVSANPYATQVSDKFNFVFTGGNNNGFPFKMVDSDKYLYYYKGHQDVYKSTYTQAYNDYKLYQVTLYAPSGKTFEDYKDYQVICVTSVENPTVSGEVITDPDETKLVAYIFHFNADGYSATSSELTKGMTITRDHNSKVTAELDLATSEHFSSVNAKFYNHLNDNSNVEKLYIRWHLADENGEVIPTPAGITLSPVYAGYADKVIDGTNFGKVLHLGNAGAVVTADMLKMNVEVTDGDIDLNDYQVVCALGYADDGYTTEPSPLKVKYIYSFKSSFEGKLSSTPITHTKEVIVNSDATTVTIPINDYFSEILSDLNTTAEDLGKSLHIRWYVMHGDERYVRSDLQLEAVNTEIGYKKHTGVSSSTDPENGSLYWNTATCGVADPLLEGKLNVQFTIPTVDKLWENYKVIAVLTNDISASSGQETTDDGLGGLQLTKEPQVLNVQYIFSMIDSEFKFVHHKGASERDYFTHDDDVNITAQSGDYTMDKTTIFLPSAINATGGRGDGFFISDRYTLGSAKQSNIDPETGEALSKGANDLYPKFGGLTVKKDNPLKTAKFKISGVNSVVAYLVSTNKSESRTCYATATPSDGSDVVAVCGTSEHEGMTAVITLNLDPLKEYVVDFSDSRKTGTENGADLSLLGVRFIKDGTESEVYTPEQLVQYSWDNANSRVNIAERPDIRQSVHTVHYYVYTKTTDSEKVLRLPFQYYDGGGNPLEPMAYIRWYDWTADLSSKRLVMKGTLLKELTDVAGNRGFFMLNNSVPNLQPCHDNVGVTYNPSSLTKDGDIIACDVSKYYDGLYPGTADDDRTGFEGKKYPQLVHEPTLSIRYLFHVFPSSVIVKDIKDAADKFENALSGLTSENFAERKKTMFNLYEDNGRVVVSLNGSAGKFAVRAQLQTLGEYYVSDGTVDGVQCSKIRWASYLEDENGLWLKDDNLTDNAGRIHSFTLSDFSGNYSHLTGSLGSKDITAAPGMRFHIIGYIGGGGFEAPAIHYELQFLDAPAILAENLKATDVKRTIDYLNLHYREGGAVTFDNYFADLSEPTTEAQNMLYTPLAWKEAQYGFCYPSIDKYRIRTGYSGLTPIHGDYMLLKSMGRSGVSKKGSDGGDTPAPGCNYSYWWYNEPAEVLYDCTHLRDNTKYGGYIYVDASDESRNIATLDFSASLCAGSQIYFTAAIADVTEDSHTSPQVMAHVYAKDEFGDRTHVMSFLTCVLNTVNNGDGGYKFNKWYQVYGHGNIPENIDITNFTDFTVEIDNYSENTFGADFCVDQIVFYTSTGKIQVEQTGGMCEDEDLSITALMDVENLENMVTLSNTPKTLYYKFFKITSKDNYGTITFEPCNDASLYNNGSNAYGQLDVSKYVLKADGTLDDSYAENANYVIKDGILYLKLLGNKVINLPQGYNYFIAMTKNLQAPDLSKWADPNNACEVYSKFFLPKKTFVHFLALDGDHDVVSQTVQAACGGTTADIEYYIQANYPDDNEPSGFKSLPLGTAGSLTDDGLLFDFFLGTKEQMTAKSYLGNTVSLLDVLQAYRAYERTTPTADYSATLRAEYQSVNADYYNILNNAITNNLLLLKASNKIKYELTTATTSFWAIPVNTSYTFDATSYTICNYIPFTFTLKSGSGGPELILGFDDVDYETAGTKRVLRVGLEQLNKMRTQGYILHVPVNMFKDKYGTTAGKVYLAADSYLTISAVDKELNPTEPSTTDPTLPAVGTKFAKVVPINGTDPRPWVDKDHMYLALDLSGANCEINFHEGYQYEVGTIFYDAEDEGAATPCIGDLFMVIKVVPEFVTWEAQHVDNDGNPTTTTTDYWSANWYNDGNWQRSTRDVLYKDQNVTGKVQNTATAGHPAGYDNNGEGTLSSLTTGSNPGFVPMKFTYVTLPTGNHAPSLINEPRVVGTGKGARRQGGGFLDLTRTTLLTDRSPNANTDGMLLTERQNSKPTENIYYDMLVRYGEYHTGDDPDEHYGEGCFGHRYIKSDGTWDDQGTQDLTAKVFDVEKFQGNVCREIYFKPGAELLRPHRLQYEKAWVEKELDANKWYLVSAPMKNMYAGDMYVPATAMTDYSLATPATVVGRQVTEAFQPITFSTPTYSRTNYPIYQRSWGMNNGTVYVQQNDIRANSYSANLKYNGVTTNMAEWGHTFNDVQVPYNTLTAFSIRAHKKDQADKVLIRLPKADTNYKYFRWDDVSSTPAAGSDIENVDKTDIYKLVSDYQDDTDTQTSPLEFNISDMQQQGDYVLVGNPFMVSLDMQKFFETNSALSTDGYWTYEASVAEAHAVPTKAKTTVIKPLQAFFVKKGTATKITFNKEMQIDGNFPTPPGWNDNPAPALTPALTLTTEGSKATIVLNESAAAGYVANEDVETLFDSNLADVPMVYTVAGQQAVSIDARPELDVVPFGVTCSSDEPVNVNVTVGQRSEVEGQISNLNSQISNLYVYDALTGESTEVGEDGTVTIQPNDYGRYYLTSSIAPSPWERAGGEALICVRGSQVTVTATDNLQQVRAVNISGATMYQAADCGTTCQFQLQPGTYVIEADSAAGRKTVKVFVR